MSMLVYCALLFIHFRYFHKMLVVTLKSFQVPLRYSNSNWENIDFRVLYCLFCL